MVQIRPPKNRHVADVEGHILKNDTVFLVNSNRVRPKMEIGVRGIMRREGSVFHQVAVLGNFPDILTAYKIWIRFGSHVGRANLFCVDVVNTALGQVKIGIAIDSDVAFRQHFVCV